MNRRSFFTKLASGILVATSAQVFVPKLIQVTWKRPVNPQIALLKAMARGDKRAMEAFAAYMAPVIKKVLAAAPTASMLYQDMDWNEPSDVPSYPIKLYYGPRPHPREGSVLFVAGYSEA